MFGSVGSKMFTQRTQNPIVIQTLQNSVSTLQNSVSTLQNNVQSIQQINSINNISSTTPIIINTRSSEPYIITTNGFYIVIQINSYIQIKGGGINLNNIEILNKSPSNITIQSDLKIQNYFLSPQVLNNNLIMSPYNYFNFNLFSYLGESIWLLSFV
jgi:hypothetical protein